MGVHSPMHTHHPGPLTGQAIENHERVLDYLIRSKIMI